MVDSLEAAASELTLAWDPNPEADLAGYRIFFGLESGKYTSHVDVGNKTSYTFLTIAPGKKYYFAVKAYNAANQESGYSSEIGYQPTPSEKNIGVTLVWDPNTEADLAGYRIFFGLESGKYTSHVDVGNKTSYTFLTIAPGKKYYFAAKAYNAANEESDYSAELNHQFANNDGP